MVSNAPSLPAWLKMPPPPGGWLKKIRLASVTPEKRLEGRRENGARCSEGHTVTSVDLVCPTQKCDALVIRSPIWGLSWRWVLLVLGLAVSPLNFGVAAGFDPTVYVLGALLTLCFTYVLFYSHPQTRAYALTAEALVATTIGILAFATETSLLLLTAVSLAASLVVLGLLFPFFFARSLGSAFWQTQIFVLAVWLPLVGGGIAGYLKPEVLPFVGLAAVALMFAMVLGAVRYAVPPAFRVPVAHKLRKKLKYFRLPVEIDEANVPHADVEGIDPAGLPVLVRPLGHFVKVGVRIINWLVDGIVLAWNRTVHALSVAVDGFIRFWHHVLLRLIEVVRAYYHFFRNRLMSARYTTKGFLRLVAFPLTLSAAAFVVLAAASDGVTSYVARNDWFEGQGWAWAVILILEVVAFSSLSTAALFLFLRPWHHVGRACVNVWQNLFPFAVGFFWANSMAAFLGGAAVSRIPGIDLPDSPYRFGPATALASIIWVLVIVIWVSQVISNRLAQRALQKSQVEP